LGPPLIITAEQIEEIVELLAEAVSSTFASLSS
jgi:adenosylmethionine-8-amino-7-oxononanoate aminotransferase